jgi:putative ABC transport system permease protein
MRRQTPLAWRNLTHNRRRLAVAVCGIGFAVVLMFTEAGFENALFDSQVKVFEDLNADLILSSAAYRALVSRETFAQQRMVQARACPGVKAAYPVYIQLMGTAWKGPACREHLIRVLAFDTSKPICSLAEVTACAGALEAPGAVLFDMRGKREKYGVPDSTAAVVRQTGAELGGRAVHVVGTFAMGTDFISDGNVILSQRNFARHCPQRVPGGDPLSRVDIGVLQLENPSAARQVQAQLQQALPADVKVWTKAEFIADENRFWNESMGIGFVFKLGKWIGFLVGVIICYQIINADVSDHMAEFATLKAMGRRNRYFVGLVLREALYLSLLSFVPGLLISLLLYDLLARYTGLLMTLSVPRAAAIAVWTTAMCAISGGLAMRRILAADPADLY